MSDQTNLDPELQDALERDPELMRIARMLASAKSPEPPLDGAFRAKGYAGASTFPESRA